MKKVFFCLFLIFSLLSFPATKYFSLQAPNPTCGNQVTVNVNVDNADDLIALQWRLNFDNTAFSYVGHTADPILTGWIIVPNAQPSYVAIAASTAIPIPSGTGARTLISFTFNTLSNVCDGATPVFQLRNLIWSSTTDSDVNGNDYDLSLTVSCPANPQISTPANPNPSDGATGVPIVVTLDWDDSTGANAYDLYFGTTSPPPFYGTTFSSQYAMSLNPNTQYFWYVVAYNTGNSCPSKTGTIWSFTTVCTPPGAFNNLSPANGATDQPINGLVLDWEDSSNATSYDLYFGTTSPPPLFQSDLATSTYTLNGLSNGQTYYWYVVAKNSCGNTTGAEWNFTTVPLAGVNLQYDSSIFADSCSLGGAGNANGVIDPGEAIDLLITLANSGTTGATGVSATLTTTTPGVTITTNSATYPNIPASGTGQSNNAYALSIDHLVPCGTVIDFTLNITSNEGSWTDTFQLSVGSNTITLLSENFASAVPPALPANWSSVLVNQSGLTAPVWATNATTHHPSGQPPHSSPNLVWFNSYHASSGSTARLQYNTPFNFSPFGTITMSFWMYHDTGYSGSNDRIQVQYSLDGATWNNIGPEISRYDGTTGWKEHTVDLSALSGQTTVWIAILGISAYGNDIHLDDITITGSSATPVCIECWCYTPESFNLLAPSNGATDQPINGLLLDWENSNHATAYDLYFGTTSPPPLYQSNLLTSQYVVNGLNLDTTYYWFVRAKNACGTYDSTEWSFTTASCVKIAYGFDLLNERLVSFDLTNPGSFIVIGSTTGDDPFAGDFLGNDYTKIYVLDYTLNQLVTYSTADATKTVIGPSTPNAAAPYWTGMAEYNGTLYAISTNCSGNTYLYTVNPATGAVTTIGQVTGVSCAINLGATETGLLYTLDIASDNIYRIDRTTASATLVGPVGFNASYAQGMEFDRDGATMYLAAYNVGTNQGELRSLNLSTGASTLIGAFQGGTEVDAMAITSCTGCTIIPSAFNLLSPANASTDQPVTNLTLDWEDSANTIFYNLYFGTTNPPPLYVSGITASNYLIAGPLNANTTYYWYVEAVGACGITQSTTFNFRTITVAPPPAIFFDNYSLQEDICPTGGGNHSNSIDPGETVYLNVTISNETTAGPATGIAGILSTTTPGVTILSGNTTFPDMLPGQTVGSDTPFIFQLDPAYPCGTNINFSLQINANGGTYQVNLNFSVPVGSTYVLLLNEGFENSTFPPAGWTSYNLDGGGTQWARTTTRYHSGAASAYHAYSTAGNQNGWLVTPPMSVPAGATGANFSFWEYTLYPTYYVYHGLWVCDTSSGCGTPPTNWTEIGTFGSPVASWRQQIIDLSAYQGQTIQLAFVYQGYDADNWYVDDVLFEVNSATPFCTVCTPGSPALSYNSHTITDDCLANGPGDGNGLAEPGEYVDINVLISNTGTGNATNVQATLTTSNPGVTIVTGNANYGFILAGQTKGPQAPFRVYFAENIPCFSTIDFTINITSSEGSWTGNFQINLGGTGAAVNLIYEQFESWPPAGWTIVDEQPGWSCDVWQSTAYWGVTNDTGGTGEAADADADACGDGMDTSMITPPIDLTGYVVATLEYDCNFQDYAGNGDAWTDISTDGGSTWTNLRYETTDDPATGHHVTIDLTPYVGNTIQIRFHFYTPDWDWWWQVDNVKISASTTACYVCICPPPGAFNLLAPPNGATNVPTTILLDWQDSSGATSYNLYFGTSPVPPLYQSGITQSQLNVSGLANSTTYYWFVEAVNVCGTTTSSTFSFTTESGCIPPSTPQLISPPNGATDLPLTVDLVWSGSNTNYYEVYFGPVKNYMELLGTTTSTSYTVSNLEPGTTYWWAINAINSCGNALSTFFSFTTAGLPPEEKFEMIIPAVASAEGARSSYWKTDMQIFNPNEEALDYTISFIPPETDGTATPYKISGTINPGELKIFNDLVKNTFGLDQIAGGIQITTKKYLIATARTYTLAEEGTYGQFVKGYTINDTIGVDSNKYFTRQNEVAHLVHLINSFAFRTNVGFMEVSGKNVTVNVTLFDGENNQLGTGNFNLLPKGFLQVNNIFETLNITGFYNPARAEIKVTGEGAVFAYASVVDNQSNDAIFVPAIKDGALLTTQHFAVAAHTPGAEGTFWRTDLRIFNPSEDSQEITLTFTEKNQSFTKTLEIESRKTIKYNDVVNELFQLQQDHGLLAISGNPGVISTSRIYNSSGEARTYGQFVPSSIIHKPITINQSQYILHMSSNASFRTNLGMTEIAGRPVTVEVALYTSNGTEIGKGTYNLSAYEQKQINRIFEVFNAGQIDNGYAKVTVLSGQGSVLVYASVVDNLTGDAIFVIGQ